VEGPACKVRGERVGSTRCRRCSATGSRVRKTRITPTGDTRGHPKDEATVSADAWCLRYAAIPQAARPAGPRFAQWWTAVSSVSPTSTTFGASAGKACRSPTTVEANTLRNRLYAGQHEVSAYECGERFRQRGRCRASRAARPSQVPVRSERDVAAADRAVSPLVADTAARVPARVLARVCTGASDAAPWVNTYRRSPSDPNGPARRAHRRAQQSRNE
jgi:hypothetical protein